MHLFTDEEMEKSKLAVKMFFVRENYPDNNKNYNVFLDELKLKHYILPFSLTKMRAKP